MTSPSRVERLRQKLDQAARARERIDTAERERWDSTACDQAFRRHHELVMEAAAIHCQIMGQPDRVGLLINWRSYYPRTVETEVNLQRALKRHEETAA